jgi:hypothetical protein
MGNVKNSNIKEKEKIEEYLLLFSSSLALQALFSFYYRHHL